MTQFGAVKSHTTHPIVTLDFQPFESSPRDNLGLLSQILAAPCRVYLHDRPVQTASILLKAIQSPQWILCPHISEAAAEPENTGLYHLGPSIVLVAINQLARSRDTIWLRLLGNSTQQASAIEDLLRLPLNHPHRRRTIGCLAMIQINRTDDDPMLTPVYEKWRQETQAEGYTEGHTAGEAHGRQLEREALTLKLLQEKIAPAIVARVTGYSLKQVEAVRSALAKG